MADIRKSGLIPFDWANAPDANPSPYPWVTVVGKYQTQIASHAITGTSIPPNPSLAYWDKVQWSGRYGEIWARGTGSPGLSAGWRIGFMADPDTAEDGYLVLPHNNVGPDTWIVRRYDNGSSTLLANPEFGLCTDRYALIRLNGPYLEGWRSGVFDTTTWEMVFQVTDETYSGPFYPCLGTTGSNECGWIDAGGTPYGNFTPQIIRRQHLRGDIPRSRPT